MSVKLPPNVPDVCGEGMLFGFSGMDGEQLAANPDTGIDTC